MQTKLNREIQICFFNHIKSYFKLYPIANLLFNRYTSNFVECLTIFVYQKASTRECLKGLYLN